MQNNKTENLSLTLAGLGRGLDITGQNTRPKTNVSTTDRRLRIPSHQIYDVQERLTYRRRKNDTSGHASLALTKPGAWKCRFFNEIDADNRVLIVDLSNVMIFNVCVQ